MPARFEDLPPDSRHDAERAACRFLVQNRYASLDEACQDRDLTLAGLWSLILREAGLPDCEPPAFAPFA
jgi:hypothetical protein